MMNRRMTKKFYFMSVWLLMLLVLTVPAANGQNMDLDGKTYMTFFPVDTNGYPDPDGEAAFPLFIVLGQRNDALWGSMVGIDEDALLTDFALELDASKITNGKVKGKKFSAYMEDQIAGQKIKALIKAKALKDGSILGKTTILGQKFKLRMYPVNVRNVSQGNANATMPSPNDAYVSGIYTGNVRLSGFYPTNDTNILLGALVVGGRIDILMYYLTDQGYLYMAILQGTFDSTTGQFAAQGFSPDGAIAMQGSISNGVMNYSTSIFGHNIQDKLYNFGETKLRAPVLRGVKPKQVGNDEQTRFTIKHKYALLGAAVRISNSTANPPGVSADFYINELTIGKRKIEILLTTTNKASGKIVFEVVNPSGKSTLTKPVPIK